MLAGPSDNAGARDTSGGYTTDETPEAMPLMQRSASSLYTQLDTARRDGDLGWAHTSDYVRVSEEPSVEEDEAENGYQKDTQENNVTKAFSANGVLHVCEFKYFVILATFVRYVQKMTSRISLNFETVALFSKFVRFDSEICFESNLNE